MTTPWNVYGGFDGHSRQRQRFPPRDKIPYPPGIQRYPEYNADSHANDIATPTVLDLAEFVTFFGTRPGAVNAPRSKPVADAFPIAALSEQIALSHPGSERERDDGEITCR
ncbi:hypothetical protein [Streptomyces sp. NPDC003077]|uniref:hypothetical protein n=1 Tax=Streptomyces sp. NPDC003077 TaxID=3154443 RepID=UPI0033B1A86D